MTKKGAVDDFLSVVSSQKPHQHRDRIYPLDIIQAKEMKMFPVDFQWVYMITDTNSKDMDVTSFIQKAKQETLPKTLEYHPFL